MTDTAAALAVSSGSQVRLRPLSERKEGDSWIIGRPEAGDFISVPEAAHRVVTMLREGLTVESVTARLRAETGTTFAVVDFVTALDELGFVECVDGRVSEDRAPPPPPSLPWLRAEHVRWLLRPVAWVVPAVFAIAVIVMLALHPDLVPSYRVIAWDKHSGLVLAVDVAIGWTLILLHEFAHLATARAAGAPARITLGTRLQFLVAQTDVSGVWGAPRRSRITVYLAGIAFNVSFAGMLLLIMGLTNPHGLLRSLLAVAVAEALLTLPAQLMVFMRTDVYFVLQDLTGCSNLYRDGSAYLRYLANLAICRLLRRPGPVPDPSQGLAPPERGAVRAYSTILLAGTAVCLGVEFLVSVPALIVLIARAASEIGSAPAATADGVTALLILLAWQAIWAFCWWRRHKPRVEAFTRKLLAGGRR